MAANRGDGRWACDYCNRVHWQDDILCYKCARRIPSKLAIMQAQLGLLQEESRVRYASIMDELSRLGQSIKAWEATTSESTVEHGAGMDDA